MKRDGIWYPDPPALSDKIADWQALGDTGGMTLIAGKDVLDLGPEYAVDALVLAPAAKSYTVVDSSPAILEHAKRVAPEVCPEQFDLTGRWPFADGAFDTVIDFSTLDDTSDAASGYAQAARVLKPGGTLISTYANARVIPVEATGSNAKDPTSVRTLLEGLGMMIVHDIRHDQPRATIAAQKLAGARPEAPDAFGDEALLEWVLTHVDESQGVGKKARVATLLRRELARRVLR